MEDDGKGDPRRQSKWIREKACGRLQIHPDLLKASMCENSIIKCFPFDSVSLIMEKTSQESWLYPAVDDQSSRSIFHTFPLAFTPHAHNTTLTQKPFRRGADTTHCAVWYFQCDVLSDESRSGTSLWHAARTALRNSQWESQRKSNSFPDLCSRSLNPGYQSISVGAWGQNGSALIITTALLYEIIFCVKLKWSLKQK